MALMACRWKKPDLLWIGALLAVIVDSLIGAYKFAQPFAYSFTDCGLLLCGAVLIAVGKGRE